MKKVEFDKNLFIYLCVGFILTIFISTISHELTHFVIAKVYGAPAILHYDHVTANTFLSKFNSIEEQERCSFWITFSGFAQTIIVGTVGSYMLFATRKKILVQKSLSIKQWIWVFLSLFWLTEFISLAICLYYYISYDYIPLVSDEFQIAYYLHFPGWILLVGAGIIGLIVTIQIFRLVIPKNQKFTFLLSLLIGVVGGFLLYNLVIGPWLLP